MQKKIADIKGFQKKEKRSLGERIKQEWRNNKLPYIVMIPVVLHFLAFKFGPAVFSFVLSFMKWPLIGKPRWVGLANWIEAFHDESVWLSLLNTSLFALYYVIPVIVLGFSLALLIHSGLRGLNIFKTTILVPYVTSGVIISGIWKYIFMGSSDGLVNHFLSLLGIEKILFFSNPDIAMGTLASLSVFRMAGYFMILYLAGLQSIPKLFYEAADIDGASDLQKIWYITLPLLRPIHFFATIIATIGAFKIFQQMFVLTQGGPAFSTTTIVYYLYQVGFYMLRLGYATVVAVILLVVIMSLSLIQRKYLGGDDTLY